MPAATQKLTTPQSELAAKMLSPKGPVARRPQADLRGHEDLTTNFPVAASLRSAATKLKNWFSPKTVGEQ
jgi:hypothetical protein